MWCQLVDNCRLFDGALSLHIQGQTDRTLNLAVMHFYCRNIVSRVWRCKVLHRFFASRMPGSAQTNLLTPWSRVLLEKLTGFAANQEIPRML